MTNAQPDALSQWPVQSNPALARMLRHEVGDFLQKVYATVAILQNRIPLEWELEREILARLRNQAEGCKNLLDAVQDYLTDGRLTREPVDLAAMCRDVAQTARGKYPKLEVVVEAQPVQVMSDSNRLQQVGTSLLANAAEAGARRLVVRSGPADTAGRAVWAFTDDGPGIPTEVADRVFSPFFTTRTGHAGLGLALIHKFVALHGGTVAAANQPDGGFRVTIELPVGVGTETNSG